VSRVRRRWREWTDEGPAHQDNAVHWPVRVGPTGVPTPEDGWSQAYPGDRAGRQAPAVDRKVWPSR